MTWERVGGGEGLARKGIHNRHYLVMFDREAGILEDEKALRRMNSQIHNTEMMMNQMLDEYNKVQVIHVAIRDKLQEERERISSIEDALRVKYN